MLMHDPFDDVKIALYKDDLNYCTIKPLMYKGIKVPAHFVFDGVTVKAPFTLIFSNKDLRKGIKASCFHDWMCKHKDLYRRKQATKILVELWKENGLSTWKCWIVYICVEIYQLFNGWK